MENHKRKYFDYNATTPLDPEVNTYIKTVMDKSHGNPSSIYEEGILSYKIIENSRKHIAELLNCLPEEIYFTGCGSEANNLAIKGSAFEVWGNKNHIVTTITEHPAVINTCKWLEGFGIKTTYLPVNSKGLINTSDLRDAITDKTFLVSIMTANNETGTLQPIKECARIAHDFNVLFHTDAVQAVGKIPLDNESLGVDMLSLAGHKFYAPKGIGALYIRKGVQLHSLIHGGGQEHGLRAGTENLFGIAGLGKAAELVNKRMPERGSIKILRDKLESGLFAMIPEAKLNSPIKERLPNTINITLPGLRGDAIVVEMDRRGFAISSGSACHAGSTKPSGVLLAMGLSEAEAHCTLRISLGYHTTEEGVDLFLKTFKEVVEGKKNTILFVPFR